MAQSQQQQQWQGRERRQAQGTYAGEERRKPMRQPEMPDTPGGNPEMGAQQRKDEQQDRVRQQARSQDDTH